MYPLLESIRIHQQRTYLLDYHKKRMEHSCNQLTDERISFDISSTLKEVCPTLDPNQTYKCRLTYTPHSIQSISFLPYQIKLIQQLKIVASNTIEYQHKWENRQEINRLFAQKDGADDILIIKNGRVTDTSYCTPLFYDGQKWWTSSTPLLAGTQRQYLLDQGIITSTIINQKDIAKYEKVRLVNAMIPFEVAPDIPISNIQ